VKITWDDGEQVTWRRDSLADRPIEILAGDEDNPLRRPRADRIRRHGTAARGRHVGQEPLGRGNLDARGKPTAETPPVATDAAPRPEPTTPAPRRWSPDYCGQ